jgi:hypothetical protein
MGVLFQPDKYNVQVIHKWTSNSGRWIIFYGVHYDGTQQCYDVGMFQTRTGATQRLHFKDNKPGAMITYDEVKDKLKRLKGDREAEERTQLHILGPDGKRAN